MSGYVPKVGDRVRLDIWPNLIKGVTVTAIGRKSFLATSRSGNEMSYDLNEMWRLVLDPLPVTVGDDGDVLTELRAVVVRLASLLASRTVLS